MIYDKLYDWQKKIVNNYKNRDNFGLFLDCGLGKTPVSLALAEANDCNKIIVITINSKAIEKETLPGSWLNWSKELANPPVTYNKKIFKQPVEFHQDEPAILVLNYESLYVRNSVEQTKRRRHPKCTLRPEIEAFIASCAKSNTAVIIDESHKMKDACTVQSSAINSIISKLKIVSKSLHVYLLSGTPFTLGYIDLHNQLSTLGCPMNITTYKDTFCVRGHYPSLEAWAQPIIGYKNIDLLYKLVHKYAITIKSTDVITLPEESLVKIITPTSKEFKKFMSEKLPEKDIIPGSTSVKKVPNPYFRNMAYPDMKWLADTTTTMWMRSRQLSIGFQGNGDDYEWYNFDRLNKLKELLSEKPDNYIIFVNYLPEIFSIYDICNELKYNVDVYCGDIKDTTFYEKYQSMSEADRLSNKKNIILANFKSGGTGMNWQLYNKCIMFSLPQYSDFVQAKARVHRIGQKEPTVYYMMIQDNWLDRSMLEALEQGKEYDEKMFEKGLEVMLHESK